jgi:bifunctional enzyme CysN/CysC
MSDLPLLPGRPYALLMHAKSATATISDLKFKRDINSGSELAARKLELNEIGVVNLSFDRLVPFRSYTDNKRLGSFILMTPQCFARMYVFLHKIIFIQGK